MLSNPDRTFGIEIEFIGKSIQGLTRRLRNNGIDVFAEGYNHSTRNYWKIVNDGSVKANAAQRERGVRVPREIVSPVLKGAEGLRQLKIVCEALEASGCEVNRTCGIHVHHGTDDFEIQNFRDLAKVYARFENTLDKLMPPSRRFSSNTYCQSNLNYFQSDADFARLERCNTVRDIVTFFHGRRYLKLNFCSYATHGTVEFRHHAGSLNYTKLSNWICLTQEMVERTRRGKLARPGNHNSDNWARFVAMLKFKNNNEQLKNVIKFYKNRLAA